jgi:hypothetical protein
MPTTATQTYSISGLKPAFDAATAFAGMINVSLKASTTYLAGTILGEVIATPGVYAPYANGASDGTQNASVILQYPCTTDASGNITEPGEWGQTRKSAPVYTHGTFYLQDLVLTGSGALDTNGVEDLAGRIVEGSIASGTGLLTF